MIFDPSGIVYPECISSKWGYIHWSIPIGIPYPSRKFFTAHGGNQMHIYIPFMFTSWFDCLNTTGAMFAITYIYMRCRKYIRCQITIGLDSSMDQRYIWEFLFVFYNSIYSTYMRCEFHRLVLLPGDIRVWLHPSFHDFFMLLLKTFHMKYIFGWHKRVVVAIKRLLTVNSCKAFGLSVRNLSIAVSPIDVVSWLANRSKNNKSNAMFSFIIGFGFFISSITRSKKSTVLRSAAFLRSSSC